MHPLAQKYVNLRTAQERRNILLRAGLYEKEYSPNNKRNNDCYFEIDNTTKKTLYYKAIPINVSDEDFEKIKKAYENKNADSYFVQTKPNAVTRALYASAIVIFCLSFIAGMMFMPLIPATLGVWLAGFITGTLILGIGEVIKLLNEIKQTLNFK